MHQTLRGLPSPRSAAPHRLNTSQALPSNPIVESWLESIHPSPSNNPSRTATKSTGYDPFSLEASQNGKAISGELHALPAASNSEKRLPVVRFALRAMSSMFSLVVVIVIPTYKEPYLPLDPLWTSILTLSSISLFCNAVDLVANVVWRRRELPMKVQAFVDVTIAAGSAICVAFATVQLVRLARMLDFYHAPYRVAVTCFETLIMIIHTFLFFNYFTSTHQRRLSFNQTHRLRRQRVNQTSRIVVLPSGATMMVIPRPQPRPPALAMPSPVGMSRMGPRSVPSGTNKSTRNRSMDFEGVPGSSITAMSQSAPLAATEFPTTAEPVKPTKQHIPRRRPVPSSSLVVAPAATISTIPSSRAVSHVEPQYNTPPPGPDYQPDEAELQRAARGEAQAQWVPRHLVDLDCEIRGVS